MDQRGVNVEELVDFVDNLYAQGRYMRSMEDKPQYYGSDILLYPNEVYTLKAIARQEGINQKELSRQMFRTKGATSSVVQKLKQKGLILQQEDETDSRFVRLYPTEKGWEVFRNHLEYDRQYLRRLSEQLGISVEDLIITNRVLRTMQQDMNRRYGSPDHGKARSGQK